jgi:hypothetical protein
MEIWCSYKITLIDCNEKSQFMFNFTLNLDDMLGIYEYNSLNLGCQSDKLIVSEGRRHCVNREEV